MTLGLRTFGYPADDPFERNSHNQAGIVLFESRTTTVRRPIAIREPGLSCDPLPLLVGPGVSHLECPTTDSNIPLFDIRVVHRMRDAEGGEIPIASALAPQKILYF